MALVTDEMKPAIIQEGFEITFSDDELTAFVYLEGEKLQDKELAPEVIMRNLKAAGIACGIDDSLVEKIAAEKNFDKKIKIAEGTPPEHGRPARFELCFDPERKMDFREGADGRIDFRDMNFLQNAEAGQVLVKKIPPTPGKPGRSVKNQPIPAKSGKDKNLPRGFNTERSPDGLSLTAVKSGTIVYTGSAVSIQPMTTISGSVDLSTGNITCKGSLKVIKDIKSDFKVVVDGDLEVGGNVEDAEIICNGNVFIKGGFIGLNGGCIKAKGDVTIKYVINQSIHSGGNVTIGGEAVNASIHARDEIRLIGSRAKAVGGILTAKKLISATALGANAGTRTILRVAFDTGLMVKARLIADEIERLTDDEKRIKAALVDLHRLNKSARLSPQKHGAFKRLEELEKNIPGQLRDLKRQQNEIEKKMGEFRDAAVIGEKKVFPGVEVYIGTKYKKVDSIRGPVIFKLSGNSVLASSFKKNSGEAGEKTPEAMQASVGS